MPSKHIANSYLTNTLVFISTREMLRDTDLCLDPQGCDIFQGGPASGPSQPPESVKFLGSLK